MSKKLFKDKVQLPKGLPSGSGVDELQKEFDGSIQDKVRQECDEIVSAYHKTVREYETRLRNLIEEIELTEMAGFLGQKADIENLYQLYSDSGNAKGGLNLAEFKEFIAIINAFNSLINGETEFIVMDGTVVFLHNVPFDIRLKCLLTPKSVTIDVYDRRMHDFKLIDNKIKCNSSLIRWKYLQSKFFYNWKNRVVDETTSLSDVMENATLSQISKRCFIGMETAEGQSNYYRVGSGEVHMMPVRISIRLWNELSDAMNFDDALFEVFHDLFLRILKN